MKPILVLLVSAILYLDVGFSFAQTQIQTDHNTGAVSFSGQHAGMEFTGKFERWQALLVLPPQSDPSITATFHLDSAKTGDSIYDSTLPEFDWFDVKNHPLGKFASNNIVSTGAGYQVTGDLTLKGISAPVSFTLKNANNKLTASFDINRLVYNIGLESDPDAEWVSKTISLAIIINK